MLVSKNVNYFLEIITGIYVLVVLEVRRNWNKECKAKVANVYFCIPKAPMGVLKSWVGMLGGVGPRSILMIGSVSSLLNMFFLSVHHAINDRSHIC